jgi:hypothetical protein
MGGMFDIPAFKQPQRERTQAELEAAARAILGWPQLENKPEAEPESEDQRMYRESIEAHKRACDPISEQTRNESLARLLGDEAVDWYREL